MDPNVTEIEVSNDVRASIATEKAKDLAKKLGFSECDQTKIAIATSELARNIVVHAHGKGTIVISPIKEPDRVGITVMAEDKGPGITDVKEAVEGINGSKKGLGVGLGAVKRLMDEFKIETKVREGTKIIVSKWKSDSPRA